MRMFTANCKFWAGQMAADLSLLLVVRWLTIFLTLLASSAFALTPEAGPFGFSAAQIQPERSAENATVFTVIHPVNSAPVSSISTPQEPAGNQGFLRPRYLNPDSGRFWTRDSYEGDLYDPVSLHKYLYASSDPVEYIDPSGFMTLGEVMQALKIQFNIRKNEIQAGKKAYDFTKKAVCNSGRLSFTAAAVTFGGHHTWPKFMGGPPKQILAELDPNLHLILHRLIKVLVKDDILLNELSAMGGANGSTGDWTKAMQDPAKAKQAFKILKKATLAVDKFCGFKKPARLTDILNDML